MKYSHVQRGWRIIDGKRIYFDSKAESNYYRYLSFLKSNHEILDFKYHPPVFDFSEWIKFGIRRYEIDFWIKERNGIEKWIEIKNTDNLEKMDSGSRTRIKRLKKYYPQIHFEIVTTKSIESNIGGYVSGLIFGWE